MMFISNSFIVYIQPCLSVDLWHSNIAILKSHMVIKQALSYQYLIYSFECCCIPPDWQLFSFCQIFCILWVKLQTLQLLRNAATNTSFFTYISEKIYYTGHDFSNYHNWNEQTTLTCSVSPEYRLLSVSIMKKICVYFFAWLSMRLRYLWTLLMPSASYIVWLMYVCLCFFFVYFDFDFLTTSIRKEETTGENTINFQKSIGSKLIMK